MTTPGRPQLEASAGGIIRRHVAAICGVSLVHWGGRFLPPPGDLAQLSQLADRLERRLPGLPFGVDDVALLRRTATRLRLSRGEDGSPASSAGREEVRRSLLIAEEFDALADQFADRLTDRPPDPPSAA